ncbi:OmpA family protein [Sulfurimonas sp.]|uniref:OmpA family protein n=1 Tax=Sulfurimonas sp. TaxID=2022749 RepID=UPI0035615233
MKTKASFLIALLLTLPLTAEEITQANEVVSEYQFVKPIAIEEAPVEKIAELESTDKDGDGVLDEVDRCPNTKDGEEVDEFGCLIKPDADKDGVPDADDKCPNTLEGQKVDYRGCELDSDDDGIPDSKDQCPDTSKDFVVDGYGCPQTATINVTFKSGRWDIDQKLIDDLQNFALFLKENKGYDVIIYGYTDSLGKAAANKTLSQNRANSVKEALTRYGISETRLTAIGKGELNPIGDNATKEGRALNRRIEVELLQ